MVEIVNIIVVLCLVLLFFTVVTGWVGAAVFTTALAMFVWSFEISGVIAALGILALISKDLAECALEKLLKELVDELNKKGKSKEEIKREIEREIESYPISISRNLKLRIRDYLEEISREK